ncbi:Pyridoxal phosphate-dependent transferase, major region, subdomain 2 [Penicillium griseofulvum]|uniref:Pyridoxal phosphate-dependent transferase, major region, subdomain 2 n=1 Tax=Penicillium patulum TaxID=5078 RepID=A0A135LT60_PENPA|nr:Pyridoxal phosphate-dependent transferase, major region, subdomain 2 [Penicillium griseofulvum]KXG52111.1 Pyridoxal phosphate-dependent transferase, major region, subdomain 2 [Penicillium griseofulvum]
MEGKRILLRKLQTTLGARRRDERLINPPDPSTIAQMVDFGSNDTLSLSTSGALTRSFLDQLHQNENFILGSTSTRIFEGTTQYLKDLETYLAQFHNAESALFFNSGFDANIALWSTIPQPGDFVLYDQYVHASIHDGMRNGRAKTVEFAHNDCTSFRHCLQGLRDQNPGIAGGSNLVFVALESFYSMDGDEVPIHELLDIAKTILPKRNYIFSVDEAHSNGLLGPNGSGFVCHHGLEKEIGLRVHTFGKALGSTGGIVPTSSVPDLDLTALAVVLAEPTIKLTLINYARNIIFSTAPSFVTLAATKAAYGILASEDGENRRRILQENIRHFQKTFLGHPQWASIKKKGIIHIPNEDNWNSALNQSPIIPLVTLPNESTDLAKHMHQSKFWANPVKYPIVPKGLDRVRISIHVDNTKKQIEDVIDVIMEWGTCRARLEVSRL